LLFLPYFQNLVLFSRLVSGDLDKILLFFNRFVRFAGFIVELSGLSDLPILDSGMNFSTLTVAVSCSYSFFGVNRLADWPIMKAWQVW